MQLPSFISGFKLSTLTYRGPLRPVRDWSLLLAAALALLLTSIVFHLWHFIVIARGPTVEPVKSASATPSALGSVDTLNAVFENRAAEEARYETAYHFVDPSR